MSARSATDFRGNPFPAFPKGGEVRPLVVGATWREFDPKAVDLFRVHVPEVPAGRVVYTSTRNHPGLADGDAVTPAHLAVAPPYRAGTWHECYDRADPIRGGGARFFFALDGAAAGDTVTLLFEEAAE